MLDLRFDIPCYAPQIAAFPVDPADLAALRDALADVHRGDARAVEHFVDARHDEFARATRAARWRVPRSTVERLVAVVDDHCAALPERRAELAAAAAQLRARAPAGPVLDVPAARWHWLETAFGPVRFMPEGWGSIFVDALAELLTEPRLPAKPAPVGSLGYVAEARVFRAGTDEPIAAEDADPFADDVRFTLDGERVDLAPLTFVDRVRQAIGGRTLLEMLVGPFVPSRGPGPFLPCPAAAVPLIDPASAPPLFRAHPLFPAHVLAGDEALRAARAEIAAAIAPIKPWAEGELHEHSPTDPPWDVPWSALVPRWDKWRARFEGLLDEARVRRQAVLLVDVEIGDMGPGSRMPVDEAWGEPART